jgi:hypothetical protein
MMDRRTFLCGLTLGTLAAPLAGEAQPAGRMLTRHLRNLCSRVVGLTLVSLVATAPTAVAQASIKRTHTGINPYG